MNKDWNYGILNDAVDKSSSNISLNKIQDEIGEYPVFGAKGLMKKVSFFHQEKEYLALIKDGAGIGRVSKHPPKSSILATMQYIIPKEDYDIDFVKYFLESLDFENYRTGSTIPHIYYKDYKNAVFPLVGFSEQQQIVAILDQAFEAIDQAKANIEKNIENAKELFQSKLNAVFSQRGEGWEEKTLGQLCSLITDGKHGDCENENNSGYYFLSAKDVKYDTLNYKNSRQITKEGFLETHRRTDLMPGDICMVNTGATIGRFSIAPDNPKTYRTTFQKSVAVIKTIPNLLNNRFCCYILVSDLKKLTNASSGSAVKNLLLGTLKQHLVNIPNSIDEQIKIVESLDNISKPMEEIKISYQQKLNSLDELKKAILQKAFAGELTNKEEAVELRQVAEPQGSYLKN